MSDEQERQFAQERLQVLQRARAFEDMLHTAGWKHLFALHTEWVEQARKDLRHVDTAEHAKAIDALQRWQIAEKFLDLQANFINSTISQAHEIRGNVTIDEALLMENMKHEHESTTNRSDPAGY